MSSIIFTEYTINFVWLFIDVWQKGAKKMKSRALLTLHL